jgi:tetratricopeptide (TPR) repeat protein
MNMIEKLSRFAALCAFLSVSAAALADDIQDANKLFKQGLYAQAMEKVNTVLAGKPKDAQARFLKGNIQFEQGNTPEAIATFTALTEDYPDLPEPYNNLAVIYANQGQYEKAKSALEMAIRTHPTYATAHENLGDIYAKMASQAYDRALQLEKSNTGTQTKLALIRELFGDSGKGARGGKTTVLAAADPAPVAPAAASAAPVATTTPVKKPEPVTVAAIDPAAEVVKTIQAWAAAWSAKDSRKYLGFYAKEFKTPDGLSRSAWEAQRKQRIAAPKSIKVEIREAKVKLVDATHATLTFHQTYRASHLNSQSRKLFDMVKVDGQWLIAADHSGK